MPDITKGKSIMPVETKPIHIAAPIVPGGKLCFQCTVSLLPEDMLQVKEQLQQRFPGFDIVLLPYEVSLVAYIANNA